MKPVILASRSPRRKKLLKAMGVDFKIIPSSVKEESSLRKPSFLVKELAMLKASDIAARYPEATVIGADTIVVCRGRILGKPKNSADALRLLRLQNGIKQKVYTGVAVVRRANGVQLSGYAVSTCKAKKLPDEKLKTMAAKHLDKAGGYAVQDEADPFIEKITGPKDNVVGLPCALLKKMLQKSGKRLCIQ